MKVVVAPDAFKGTLTQIEAANTMKQAVLASLPSATVVMKPMADGGEGTLDVLLNNLFENETPSLFVTGPLGREITTNIGVIHKDTAIIEVAKVIGLPLVNDADLNPFKTTTYGLGEVILFALDRGIRRFIIGLGGSATSDGGFAMLQALGARIKDDDGKRVSMYGHSLLDIHSVDLSTLDHRLEGCTFEVISDVTSSLYGENGATVSFGPQKGATNKQIQLLDQAMKNYARITLNSNNLTKELVDQHGAGAAGGLGFAFQLIGGKLVSGASYIAEVIHLEQAIHQAQFVITGEGKSDAETVSGKAPGYVAYVAQKYDVPCLLLSGTIKDSLLLESNFTGVHTLVDESVTKQEAMENSREVLYEKTKQVIKEQII